MAQEGYKPGGLDQDVVAALADMDNVLATLEFTEFECELTTYVKERYLRAVRHRQHMGVDQQLVMGAYAYRGMYDPAQLAQLEPGTHIYMPVTQVKCRAMQNWMVDILTNAVDRPYTLTPTPVPDIPPHLEAVATEKLMGYLRTGEIAPEQLAEMAEQARAIALQLVATNTKQAAEAMADRIGDQLSEGGWRDTFDELVVDASHLPAAVMVGPVVEDVKRVRWIDGQPQVRLDRVFRFRRVSPFDFFPAPGARTPQDAPYLIVVEHRSQDDLEMLKDLPGYNAEAIASLIAQQPYGNTKWHGGYGMSAMREEFEGGSREAAEVTPTQEWQVLHYYGKLPVRLAREYGVEIAPDKSYQGMVEVELEICAGFVLRAVTTPYPADRRPIYVFGFQRRAGTIWYDSLPWVLRDVQRGANAAMRALVKNMALSAGPVVEADIERMTEERDITSIVPYRVYKVTADPMKTTPSPALRFNQMQSTALHLLRVWAEFSNQADEVSGIPAYVAGNPDVAGAGRTLGGLAMLMGNAAKGIKRIIGHADNGLIQPMVEMLYMINMLYLDDDSVKADAQIVARGAAGLLQRELSQSRAIELLNVLLQPAVQQQGIVTPDKIQVLLRDIAASMGYDPDLVGNEAVEQQLMTALQTAGISLDGMAQPGVGSGAGVGVGSAVPQVPTLDGRSRPPVDPSSLEMIG